MFLLYQIITSILIIFSPIIIAYRILIKKEDKKRFLEKYSLPSKLKKKGKLIWFHGASVGELLSIIPLVKNYENNKSIKQILITSSTLSSSKVLKKYKFKKTVHQFYPIDHIFFTRKFLNHWNPTLAIFIDSEIWPCMFKNLHNKKIPLVLLNARLTNKSFKNWIKLNNFAKSIFDYITIAFPQNIETRKYLKQLNFKKIKEIGNLKFVENYEEKLIKINNKLNKKFKSKKIWVASSTHKKEELFCAQTHLELKKKVKNLLTIIIPRHVHRINEIKSEINNFNLKISCHSSRVENLKKVDIYIVDTF